LKGVDDLASLIQMSSYLFDNANKLEIGVKRAADLLDTSSLFDKPVAKKRSKNWTKFRCS
jgi:hypothetical protein